MLWTANTVKLALVEAFAINSITGGRIGPKEYGTAMPDVFLTDVDLFVMEREDLQDEEHGGTNGAHFAKMKSAQRGKIIRKRQISAQQVSQMETVLLGRGKHKPWLSGYLNDLNQFQPRQCIEAYSVQSARFELVGKEFKENRFCKRVGWSYSTYRSRRDRAADIVSFRLNDDGVNAWIQDNKPVAANPGMPLTEALLIFLKDGPKSKARFVSFAHSHRIIEAADVRDYSVQRAIGALIAAGRVRKRVDGLLERA